MTVHNTSKKDYTFDIKVLDENIFVKRFKTIHLKSKEKRKTVLILATKNRIKNKKVKVLFFAKENKDIKLFKKIVFYTPKK